MGKIILCRGKKADTPLTVLQTGVKLYTAEAVSYTHLTLPTIA